MELAVLPRGEEPLIGRRPTSMSAVVVVVWCVLARIGNGAGGAACEQQAQNQQGQPKVFRHSRLRVNGASCPCGRDPSRPVVVWSSPPDQAAQASPLVDELPDP